MNLYKRIMPIANVPTNIITGFLGVGKTTAILNLLKHKPAHERWAVLVNEFGEIGVDGAILSGLNAEKNGVYIKEVSGGCMCCTAGVSMVVNLNKLLQQSKPDRLLIEPTGLGHPLEVYDILKSERYKDVLSVQSLITLVDARKLAEPRYTGHATFNQQVDIADVVIGNKVDLYQKGDRDALDAFVTEKVKSSGKPKTLVFTQNAEFDSALLNGLCEGQPSANSLFSSAFMSEAFERDVESLSDTGSGIQVVQTNQEGLESIGWRFSSEYLFDRSQLVSLIRRIAEGELERLKAVFMTPEGPIGFNVNEGAVNELVLPALTESRIEILAKTVDERWQAQIKACLCSSP